MDLLRSQFHEAQRIGGMSNVKKQRTRTGIKDSFQTWFLERLFKVTTRKGQSRNSKEADIAALLNEFPPGEQTMSPIWRIQGRLEPYTVEFTELSSCFRL